MMIHAATAEHDPDSHEFLSHKHSEFDPAAAEAGVHCHGSQAGTKPAHLDILQSGDTDHPQ